MSQVTENKVISAPVPRPRYRSSGTILNATKARSSGGLRRHRAVHRDLCQLDCTLYPAEQFRDALLAPPAWQEGGTWRTCWAPMT